MQVKIILFTQAAGDAQNVNNTVTNIYRRENMNLSASSRIEYYWGCNEYALIEHSNFNERIRMYTVTTIVWYLIIDMVVCR